MSTRHTFTVVIGQHAIKCDSGVDAAILEPVGGILLDGSTDGYGIEELELMLTVLTRYDRGDSLQRFEQLVEQRRMSVKS